MNNLTHKVHGCVRRCVLLQTCSINWLDFTFTPCECISDAVDIQLQEIWSNICKCSLKTDGDKRITGNASHLISSHPTGAVAVQLPGRLDDPAQFDLE